MSPPATQFNTLICTKSRRDAIYMRKDPDIATNKELFSRFIVGKRFLQYSLYVS